MTKKTPGKSQLKGLTLLEFADMFRDEETARAWIADLTIDNGLPSGARS